MLCLAPFETTIWEAKSSPLSRLNFAQMASHILQPRNRRVVRDVLLDGFNARLFEHLWCVKIRFPEEREMTSAPDCFNSVAFRAIAMVADSEGG